MEPTTDPIQRGDEAQMLLNHPLMQEALQVMRADLTHQLMMTPIDTPDVERRLVDMLRMHERFEQTLRSIIDTGKITALRMDPKKGMFARLREGVRSAY